MANVIIIYANCRNPSAKGDFALAGQLAKEVQSELNSNASDIKVILTSTLDGYERLTSMYGVPVEGKVNIEGVSIKLLPLEYINPVKNNTVAYIEANRCKYAPADLVKRVLSPSSKMLFVGNANQPVLDQMTQLLYRFKISSDQEGIYDYIVPGDVHISPVGLGKQRYGLPSIASIESLDELSLVEKAKIPSQNYAFMYLSADFNPSGFQKEIAQFTLLANQQNYVLIGKFSAHQERIQTEVSLATKQVVSFHNKPIDHDSGIAITHYAQVNNCLMRNMMASSNSEFVMTTGVGSTLEAMLDKIPYYQYADTNEHFVASYLLALRDFMTQKDVIPETVFELSSLLFKQKPLSPKDFSRAQELGRISVLTNYLKSSNKAIVESAQGKVGKQLLSFIGSSSSRSKHQQVVVALENLKKPSEKTTPTLHQALRRAAAWGKLFELKILIENLPSQDISKRDTTHSHRSALHWAVIQNQSHCRDYLIQEGADLDSVDKQGKTPLHYAVAQNDQQAIKALILAGASMNIKDNTSLTACQCASKETYEFIQKCMQHQVLVSSF